MILFMAFSLPSLIILAVGLLPTGVAFIIDRSDQKSGTFCVGGMNLSGGQRHAVAVARAPLLDPPVLVLDEPTSAMDNSSEERLKRQLQPILHNRTLLLVTHRASMLSLVNRLIVIDGGKIVADGPKEQVLEALRKGHVNVARS